MELTAKQIQKYSRFTLSELEKKAERAFNKFIRIRDRDQPCISCGSYTGSQAGHYYSAGHYHETKFNELNCNLQCVRCNMYLSGNLIEYRKGLVKKIGVDQVEKLDETVAKYKQIIYKKDRFFMIQIILKYSK